jgi:hypothetical protein
MWGVMCRIVEAQAAAQLRKTKAGRASGKMLSHIAQQLSRTIGKTHRPQQSFVIAKTHRDAMLVDIEPRENFVVARNEIQT